MKIHGRPPSGHVHRHLELALDRVVVPLHDHHRIEGGVSVVIDESGRSLAARDVSETVYLDPNTPVDVDRLNSVAKALAESLPRYASEIAMLPPVWDWDVNHPPKVRVTFWARVAG